jgi:hypothetical protein
MNPIDGDKLIGHLNFFDEKCLPLGYDFLQDIQFAVDSTVGDSLFFAGVKDGYPSTQEWMILIAVELGKGRSPRMVKHSVRTFLIHVPTKTPIVACWGSCALEDGSWASFLKGSVLRWTMDGVIQETWGKQRGDHEVKKQVELPCSPYYRDLFFSLTPSIASTLQILILGYLYPWIAQNYDEFISTLDIICPDEKMRQEFEDVLMTFSGIQ